MGKKMINYFYFDETLDYPAKAPYGPAEIYPEYPFEANSIDGTEDNGVYSAIRNILIETGLDHEHFEKKEWNPFGGFIKEGQTVLLKPNLVMDVNPAVDNYEKGMECLITHPSVVRCLFDYSYIALKGRGTIIIADAPVQGCDFDRLLEKTGYGDLFDFFLSQRTCDMKIITADLREVTYRKENGVPIQELRKDMVFKGVDVDLGTKSHFSKLDNNRRLRVTLYDGKDTVRNHNKNKNVYRISEAILCADVVISIPKPKTHRIAGYTGALKNMIGVNARKEYLPHHQIGSKDDGGDEYIASHKTLKRMNSWANDKANWALKYGHKRIWRFLDEMGRITGKRLDMYESNRVKYGMWYGNDTIWRTILDLNRIVYYADKNGRMCDKPQRNILYFGDMIVSGDHEGPLNPSYKKVGGILFSDNPVEFDMCVVKMMGFDWHRLPTLYNALEDPYLSIDDSMLVCMKSNDEEFNCFIKDLSRNFGFVPTKGWKGWI